MLILVGFKLKDEYEYCKKDEYECYDGLWIWYRMDTNVKGWIMNLI